MQQCRSTTFNLYTCRRLCVHTCSPAPGDVPLSAAHFLRLALIQSVSLLLSDNKATCSAHNIYPAPRVTWSTEPPSAAEELENSTVKTADHKGLFHVESTLRILGNLSNRTYFCSVTSTDKTQVWTASWRNQGVRCVHPHPECRRIEEKLCLFAVLNQLNSVAFKVTRRFIYIKSSFFFEEEKENYSWYLLNFLIFDQMMKLYTV